jgi:hypothetical protein
MKDFCSVFSPLKCSKWIFDGLNPKWGAFKNTLWFFFFFSGPHLSWFFWSSHSPLGFSELATIMASSSHYCPYCGRNSVCLLTYHIDIHPQPADDENSGDVMVTGHCHMCGSWLSLNMLMAVAVQTVPQFCFDFLSILYGQFPPLLVYFCPQIWNIYNLIIGIISSYYSGLLEIKKLWILMKIYCIFWLECFFSLSFLQARPCMYLHYLDWSQTIFTCRINLWILWSFIESAKAHQKILHLIDHSYRCPKWNFEAILVVTWCQKVLLTFLPATVSPVTSGIWF